MSISIAIIDSGVEKEHNRLQSAKIEGCTVLHERDGKFSIIEDVFDDDTGHGTAVASIIHKLNPKVKIFAIKLSASNEIITQELLNEGIKLCLKHTDIKIINISMGIATQEPSFELYETCKNVSEQGIAIVASAHNFVDKHCYPAFFPFVFGVSIGVVDTKMDYKYTGEGPVNILAKGTIQRVAWKNNEFRITSGTSFAAAHFSAILSKKLIADYSNKEILISVKEGSNHSVTELHYIKQFEKIQIHSRTEKELNTLGQALFCAHSKLSFAKKAALFPLSEKENNTLIEFKDLSTLEFSVFIDYPKKLNKINFQNNLLKDLKVIRRELEDEEFNSFDTIVVGYILDQYFGTNIRFADKLVKKCLHFNKNFIVWDKYVYSYIKKIQGSEYPHYRGHIYCPNIDDEFYEKVKEFAYLPKVKVPVVAVIGTSSRQGKLTAQLRLKEILSNVGYKVSFLSTEPHGCLLGADFSFPYGFKSNVSIDCMRWNQHIHIALKGIQKYGNPHIILTGIQGGLIPRGKNLTSKSEFYLSSLSYLASVKPDAVICAINPSDSIDVIAQSIQSVETFCKSANLFFVMTPWQRCFISNSTSNYTASYKILDSEEMEAKMSEYEKLLGKPVKNIMNPEVDSFVINTIQSAFS